MLQKTTEAGVVRESVENPLLFLGLELPDEVDGVVVRELEEKLSPFLGPQGGEELGAVVACVHLRQSLRSQLGWKQRQEPDAFALVEILDKVRQVGRVQ